MRRIKHTLTERYYAWQDAAELAKSDPEIDLTPGHEGMRTSDPDYAEAEDDETQQQQQQQQRSTFDGRPEPMDAEERAESEARRADKARERFMMAEEKGEKAGARV